MFAQFDMMKSYNGKLVGILALLMIVGMECGAATHYVVPPGAAGTVPADPYTNWATAGTNIIDVVNAAMTNIATRVVWVTNGTYYPTNSIYMTNAITLKSFNGRDVTILNGQNIAGSVPYRYCIRITGSSLTLDGFTVTKYNASASGVISCDAWSDTIQNCSFVNNTNTGDGIVMSSAASITNCIFRNNIAAKAGGIYGGYERIIQGCLFEGNRASAGSGGAVWINGSYNTILNCTFIGNSASDSAGAIYAEKATIRNCLIASNSALTNAGGIYLVYTGIVESCTIVSNYAGGAGGGLYVTNSDAAVGTNNIIYHNTAASAPNYTNATIGNAGLDYSCVYPEVAGTGNKTNDPGLVNLWGGNYRLGTNSPCVNTGTNQNWMQGAVDLNGRTRIRYGRVDMGAYECYLKVNAAMDVWPESMATFDPVVIRTLLARAGEDATPFKARTEQLVTQMTDLKAKADAGDWSADAELAKLAPEFEILIWKLEIFALLNAP